MTSHPSPHGLHDHLTDSSVTLHTFSEREIDTIEEALGIAAAHLHAMTEVDTPYARQYRDGLLKATREMCELRLKIQAAR